MKKAITTLIAILLTVLSVAAPPSIAQVVRDGATTLIFYNSSNADVTVMVAVPALPCAAPCVQSDGCPTGTVANLRTINLSTAGQPQSLKQFGTTASGWFILPRGQRVQLLNMGINPFTKQVSSCFQGMIVGFGQFGNQCPDLGTKRTAFPDIRPGATFNNPVNPPIALPNGSNSFECTLNLPGTVNGATVVGTTQVPVAESMDISCVNGANSEIMVTITPPPNGPFWNALTSTAQGGVKVFKTTHTFGPNSWVDLARRRDNNCVDPATGYARPGVFPYGCSQCNTYPDPAPPCSAHPIPQICAARNGFTPNNGCLFDRNPMVRGVQRFGGTVLVTYRGPIQPPP